MHFGYYITSYSVFRSFIFLKTLLRILKNGDQMGNDSDFLKTYEGTQWMYFTAKPQCEKSLYNALSAQHVVCYLPLIKKVTEYSHRVYTRMVPMFPGYVFASVCRAEFKTTLYSSFLGRCYYLDEIQASALLKDLVTVRKYELLAQEHKVQVLVDLNIGDPVLITHGYFKGERAVIKRISKERDEVIAELTALQMALSVQLPVDFLSKEF